MKKRVRELLADADEMERLGHRAWAIDYIEAAWNLATGEDYLEDTILSMEVGNAMMALLKKVRPK